MCACELYEVDADLCYIFGTAIITLCTIGYVYGHYKITGRVSDTKSSLKHDNADIEKVFSLFFFGCCCCHLLYKIICF